MRFVPVKDVAQQSVPMLHRARNLLVRQRTMLVNALRAHLARFGVIAPRGLRHVEQLIAAIDADDLALPELARAILRLVVAQLNDTQAKVRQIEAKLAKWHRSDRVSKLLATVPGVGTVGASAIAATVCDPSLFRSRREFAAWHDAAPKSLGGKERLGRTSKRGDKYIRFLLVAGAVAILRHGRNRATKDAEWVHPRREREDCFLLRDGDAVKCCLRGRCFSPRRRLDVAPFHSQFSRRACLARCEKETNVWRLSIAFAGPFHLLAAGEPRREIGNRPRIDIGLVPFLDDGEIGRSWSPGAPTLPAIAPKVISGRGQNVGHAMDEITAAVAIEIDREFKIGRRHELGLADFAGPGAARAGRQVAALN
jgi:hypothetical protein